MGGESTNSSQSTQRPLTAAERQDLYRASIGNIISTYNQSGLPYGGVGSMNANATNATFDPNAPAVSHVSAPNGGYSASGSAQSYNKGGQVTLDPKTYFQAPNPDVSMPTGGADPGGINVPVYQIPEYQSSGPFKSAGYTAGLDYAKRKDQESLNNELAKRGIWSSGLATQAMTDLNSAYAPAYEKAGADQATAENAFNLTAADKANNFNVTNANNAYAAGWRPLDYLANAWGGTSGQVGGSSSFGQSLSMNI